MPSDFTIRLASGESVLLDPEDWENARNFSWSAFRDGVRFNLGTFSEKKEAVTAYIVAARVHHGEFARTG
jgi:hypothetical protein